MKRKNETPEEYAARARKYQVNMRAKKPIKRTGVSSRLRRRDRVRKQGKSETARCKVRIQATLREKAIQRDGGCILRFFPETGRCGPEKTDGTLILQAEHLNNRQHSNSFGNMANIVCICMNHHIFFKKREPVLYWDCVRKHIGELRWEMVQVWTRDRAPCRMTLSDWLAIEEELKSITY